MTGDEREARIEQLVTATGLTRLEVIDAGLTLAGYLVHGGKMLDCEEIWIDDIPTFFDQHRFKPLDYAHFLP